MIKAMYTAATGMNAQQTNIDVIANNLANVNTAGFKRSSVHFQDMLYSTLKAPGAQDGNGASLSGIQIGSGSRLLSTSKAFSNGSLTQTDQPLDLAISGEGFFELQGPGGQRFYTRDGNFTRDVNGDVVNSSGFRLVPGINLPEGAQDISIQRDGTVNYVQNGANQIAGQINTVRFLNPAGLAAMGENLYTETDNSGAAVVGIAGENGMGILVQGYEERSNVDVATELISMIVAQRAFEMNSKAIQTADSMLNTVSTMSR